MFKKTKSSILTGAEKARVRSFSVDIVGSSNGSWGQIVAFNVNFTSVAEEPEARAAPKAERKVFFEPSSAKSET